MTDYVNPPPPLASLPVSTGGQRFPIRRVFCVGRNYAAHAREMGKDPDSEPPFFFMKPADAVVDARATAGVGPMQPGDDVAGGVQGITEFDFKIGARPT